MIAGILFIAAAIAGYYFMGMLINEKS